MAHQVGLQLVADLASFTFGWGFVTLGGVWPSASKIQVWKLSVVRTRDTICRPG